LLANLLLPALPCFQLNEISADESAITLILTMTSATAACPLCHQASRRLHSRYTRTLADLPWARIPVRLRLRVRRFFCDQADCRRRIFTERLDPAIAPHARRTRRLEALLESLGVSLGGEAGAPLSRRSGMPTSPSTLLRLLRRATEPKAPTPRVLGVDDWAKRKRHAYGTILVDLERHRPVDLLPDREPTSLANWLRDHPGVEIITRDRSSDYAQGAAEGAPHAVQVADRWHLLGNWREALQRLLERHPEQLRAAAKQVADATTTAQTETSGEATVALSEPDSQASSLETESPRPRSAAEVRFEEIQALRQAGWSQRAIARKLRLHRRTVQRYARATTVPERGRGPQSISSVLPYLQYLRKRWSEGCHNRLQLWKELQTQGYRGSYSSVHRALARFPHPRQGRAIAPRSGEAPRLSASQAAWLLVRPAEDLTAQEEAKRTALCEKCSAAAIAYPLSQRFGQMVRARQAEKLDLWFTEAAASTVAELRNFAASLRRDEPAVRAALTLPWSNGQVEGQVNRLKTIKRQMYGRGHFDLLRRRVLYHAN
jgi:transposase